MTSLATVGKAATEVVWLKRVCSNCGDAGKILGLCDAVHRLVIEVFVLHGVTIISYVVPQHPIQTKTAPVSYNHCAIHETM